MIKTQISIAEALRVLNELVKIDPEAMKELVELRVECNETMANFYGVQVLADGEKYKVGLLGVLNALFGESETGFGIISATSELICPNGHKPDKDSGAKNGDGCNQCNEAFTVGDLVGFERMPDKYLYNKGV